MSSCNHAKRMPFQRPACNLYPFPSRSTGTPSATRSLDQSMHDDLSRHYLCAGVIDSRWALGSNFVAEMDYRTGNRRSRTNRIV
ncbi:hypothetical protein BTUL_0065g00570 [Botrytis tulipae]|uniref:Uncharacterized protein n=1 Tax=Botrytis tulipae TaxID=87230 RepID=A0A4Z1EQU2_9HELO|nr:hypothetical protein BTUL_0065g00570 [Botrytis tulipae]